MSRAFVKEDDQEEAPFIPPRAPLPTGESNYVTPAGKEALLKEKELLELEKEQLKKIEKESDRRKSQLEINGKLKLLEERINSAKVIINDNQNPHEVRFGALIKFKMNNQIQNFQIVGADEADVKQQKIAFFSPIARALTGKQKGDTTSFQLGKETREIEILNIEY
ncbi:GreA/GreB family elongation factor [Marivirga arenosa]|uniref:GreA/GreB family elongation factor n=1 Tax=Marivirga arenosa TaxID=3059076 RepID=A0AA49JDM7_9BACT|nr:GreA/GreB family elongation factor [Marivirga sp. ABR2-2]WKK84287.2 GreA/GreB family elongation factor [Marivirga sp. ABR2-2]